MTDEEQREIWLKRLLPALAILVVYFVFFSHILTEDREKAENSYQSLAQKGISEKSLPGLNKQLQRIQSELTQLAKEDQLLHSKLKANNGVLSGEAFANIAIARVSFLLAKHHLHIIEEKRAHKVDINQLAKSYQETGTWLLDILADEQDAMQMLELRFRGSYLDTLNAMDAFTSKKIRALPVSLSMTLPPADSDRTLRGSDLEWTLKLWL